MSADGDTVRAALETDDASFGHPDSITEEALAALARLEAAEAQRDALAEALEQAREAYEDLNSPSTPLDDREGSWLKLGAALAETGLEADPAGSVEPS